MDTKIIFWQGDVGGCFDMAPLCRKHPTLWLDLDFAGSLEQVAISCVLPALKGKEEGAYGQSWKEDPEAEPSLRISSELIFVH